MHGDLSHAIMKMLMLLIFKPLSSGKEIVMCTGIGLPDLNICPRCERANPDTYYEVECHPLKLK